MGASSTTMMYAYSRVSRCAHDGRLSDASQSILLVHYAYIYVCHMHTPVYAYAYNILEYSVVIRSTEYYSTFLRVIFIYICIHDVVLVSFFTTTLGTTT